MLINFRDWISVVIKKIYVLYKVHIKFEIKT